MKRMIILCAVAVLLATVGPVSADTVTDAKAKLKELREQKSREIIGHDEAVHRLHAESEATIASIKEEYRRSYNQAVRDRDEKMAALRKTYEEKLRPILKEEKELIAVAGPGEESNFARTSAERMRGS